MAFPKRIALVQRSVSHFRVPVINELTKNSARSWLLLTGKGEGIKKGYSGLDGASAVEMEMEFINVRRLGEYSWISGLNLVRRKVDALVLEGSLSILSNIPLLLWCRLNSIPVVLWTKGMRQNRKKRRGLNRLYEKVVFSLVSRFIVYGRLSVDDLMEKGIPREEIFVAQNSIDTDCILARQFGSNNKREPSEESDVLTFGYMGRLCPDKNVEFIIDAFAEFLKEADACVDSRLLIAGGGANRDLLLRQVDERNLNGKVTFMGVIPIGEEATFFSQTDVYLSVRSHGLGIIEAMAYGLAVLITPEEGPEAENVIDKHTGLISRDATLTEFINSMCFLAASPKERIQLGCRAVNHVREKLGVKNMVKEIEAAIESIEVKS